MSQVTLRPPVPGHRVPPLTGTLPPHCQRDLATLRGFVRDALTRATPRDPVSPADFRHVLVTGATGFLGRFLLRDLLTRDPRLTVHCIVRGDTPEQGFERVRANMQHAETWDDDFASRIEVHAGDIAEPRFGLSESRFRSLCEEIDAVYHLAAALSLSASYLGIRRVNSFSIRNVLELCLHTRFKHLFHASTMGIFPEYFCAFALEYENSRIDDQMQPDLAGMKRMFPLGLLGYPWSKLVAEQAILFANAAGLPVAIFRLAQTSLASTGYTQPSNITQRLFSAVVDAGMIPRGFTLQSNNDPVDTLSNICTGISLNPRRRFTVYNCCNPTPSYRTIRVEELGLDYPEVSYKAFRSACQARGDASPLAGYWALVDHFARYWLRGRDSATSLPISDRAIREDFPGTIRWPGPLTRYVRYNRWIREHRDEWPHPEPRRRLKLDHLLRQARRYADDRGLSFDSTYPEWMLDAMKQLVRALKSPEAGLLDTRVGHVAFDMCRMLRNNAELAAERLRFPEIDRLKVTHPVFIVGINRTGTTYLHRLMARDDRFWALRAYEYVEPVLPGGEYAGVAGTPDDPRRALAADVFEASGIIDSFSGIHHIDIDGPEEDMPILRLSFKAWMFATRYYVPEYERWLEASGSREAYHHHRRVMQHYTYQRMQSHSGAEGQWLFKMPTHLMELEALIDAYPDALFIQTHREPVQFMGSWCSLVERIRADVGEPRPPDVLGAEQLRAMSGLLDRAVDFRESHPELEARWIDVSYYDLVQDPMSVVARIYERRGWELRPDAEEAMEIWLDEQRERRRTEQRHKYDIAAYGLTRDMIDTAFARYREFLSESDRRASLL